MALYNAQLKFIYLFEPHTASRAILEALPKFVAGTSNISHHHIGIEEMTNWRRMRIHPKLVLQSRVICTVRNPFDTLITKWRFGPYKDVSFLRFVNLHPKHQAIISPCMGLANEAEYFCWFEDLESDLQWMFNREDLKLGYAPKHKTPKKQPWFTYYEGQPELVDRLNTLYKGYMDKFGYSVTYKDGRPHLVIDKSTRARLCQQLL